MDTGNQIMKKEEIKTAAGMVPVAVEQIVRLTGISSSTGLVTGNTSASCTAEDSFPKNTPYTPKSRLRPLKTPWQRRWLDLEVTNPELQSAADDLAQWWRDFTRRDRVALRHVMLIGQSGTGKTRMAERMNFLASRSAIWCWEQKWWPAPPRIVWVEWAKIASLPQDEFKRWCDGMCDVGLIFLEDVGAEIDKFKSAESTERFREVMNDCKNKWLFITSNVMPEHWSSRWDERIADRLLRNSRVIALRETPRYDFKNI